MSVKAAVGSALAAALVVLAVMAVLERALIRPGPTLKRPWRAWALFAGGLWAPLGLLTGLAGNCWLAAGGLTAAFLILVLINKAKVASLREPFVFQDYEYFLDMLRHPRLYLPFFGWKYFFVSAAGVLALLWLVFSGTVFTLSFDWPGAAVGGAAVTLIGLAALWAAERKPPAVSFRPWADLAELGLVACLWRYGLAGRRLPAVESPLAALTPGPAAAARGSSEVRPHLVAVQSESFFDPRSLYSALNPSLLAQYDRLKSQALARGRLRVPAWGANTVRTEFSFLSGLDADRLGAFQFNPYKAVARGWQVETLAGLLRRYGYRTVCLHPYHKTFYQRDRVLPRLGFEAFLGLEAFEGAGHFGPYVGDLAVAEKILEILREAARPTFLFVITMENHGPLHLEKLGPDDADQLYAVPPAPGCDDLTVYLRHIRNADAMIGRLAGEGAKLSAPLELCWYGDHVPIMPRAYAAYGDPGGEVEYVIWSGGRQGLAEPVHISVDELAGVWLKNLGWGGL